jgi:uncharacterized phosphosugar-binding protein
MRSLEYITAVTDNLKVVTAQRDSIKKAAEIIVQAILSGKIIYVADTYGIMDSELVERTGGLAVFRALKSGGKQMAQGDVCIIASYHPDLESDVILMTQAHSLGAVVITLSPTGKLAQQAECAIVNDSDIHNGVISVPGLSHPFCPISGIINIALAWGLCTEITSQLMAKGKIPTVYSGDYIVDGAEKLSQQRKRFSSLGY